MCVINFATLILQIHSVKLQIFPILQVLLKIEPIDELQRVSREIPVEGHAGIPCVVHEEALWHERVISLRKIQSQLHSETTRDLVAYLEQQNNKYATGVHEMRNELKKVFSIKNDFVRCQQSWKVWLRTKLFAKFQELVFKRQLTSGHKFLNSNRSVGFLVKICSRLRKSSMRWKFFYVYHFFNIWFRHLIISMEFLTGPL